MKILKLIIDFLFGKPKYDCVNCVHGTSTGGGICMDCDGIKHYEDIRMEE